MRGIGLGMKSPRRPPRERPSEELLASKYTTPCFFAGLDQGDAEETCGACGGTGQTMDGGGYASSAPCPSCDGTGARPGLPTQHVCDGPMDLFHFIPAQRLRAAHAPVWDPRIVAVSCRRHHHLLDNYFLRIPRDQLPPAVEEYAEEHGLTSSLDRDYGPIREAV